MRDRRPPTIAFFYEGEGPTLLPCPKDAGHPSNVACRNRDDFAPCRVERVELDGLPGPQAEHASEQFSRGRLHQDSVAEFRGCSRRDHDQVTVAVKGARTRGRRSPARRRPRARCQSDRRCSIQSQLEDHPDRRVFRLGLVMPIAGTALRGSNPERPQIITQANVAEFPIRGFPASSATPCRAGGSKEFEVGGVRLALLRVHLRLERDFVAIVQ